MPGTPGRDSVHEIVALYKRDLDVTLIEANLRLTVDQRIAQLQRLLEVADALRHAPRVDASRQ
jgi:hypothetical protein